MTDRPLHVVIAGGGVAGLEALLALRALAEDRVTIDWLSPDEQFVYRPLEVGGAFRLGNPRRYALAAIADARGATLHHDTLHSVNRQERIAAGRSGEEFHYDALIVAVGGRAEPALPGALTYTGRHEAPAMRGLLEELRTGAARSAAFVVPFGASWPLPAYELALLTAAEMADAQGRRQLLIVTPEGRPLEVFGRRASDELAALLEARGIEFVGSARPVRVAGDELLLSGDKPPVEVDRVVALPHIAGRVIPGLKPSRPDGFLATDAHGRVFGTERIWAAGDIADFRIKQGGLAAQQADAVAEDIAALAGARLTPKPFEPVLRGLLLTGGTPRYLRASQTPGDPAEADVSEHALWWPPSKIAGRYLSAYLGAAQDHSILGEHARPDAVPIEVRLEHEWEAAHPEGPHPPSYHDPTSSVIR
jgi:sulfide:quinone oxidoreductase